MEVQYNPAFKEFFDSTAFYKVLYGSAGCFDADTLVCTSTGYKRICEIKVGEKVLSFNEKTKKPEYKRVVNTFRYDMESLNTDAVTFVFKDMKLTCTAEHKFYYQGEWITAVGIIERYWDEVVEPKRIYTHDEVAIEINIGDIRTVELLNPVEYVYDLEVEDNHNYTVTTDNIIVHNSGKSYAIAQKIVKRLLLEEGHAAWCFRKVSTFVEHSVYETLVEVIRSYGAYDLCSFNKTQKIIKFPNGNRAYCSGLDEQEKIKSILKITIAWVEEATEFDEQDVNQIDLRMRGKSNIYKELILSFNPITELHWIKRKFFDKVVDGVKEKMYTLHTTYQDNYFLDKDYIERLLNVHTHDPNNYRVYVLGHWGRVTTGQEYYKWFDMDKHTGETKLDPTLPVHISFDFNVMPYMSLTVWQIIKGDGKWLVRGIEEILGHHPKNSTEDVCHMFYDKYEDKCGAGLLIYGDATGRARKTSSKKTDYMIIDNILGRLVVDIRVPRSNPLPYDTHTFVNRLMFGGYPIDFLINEEMKYTIQDITHVLEDGDRRKVKKAARDPVSKQVVELYGHLSDSMDYFLMQAFQAYLN